jgi:hypothetical protein
MVNPQGCHPLQAHLVLDKTFTYNQLGFAARLLHRQLRALPPWCPAKRLHANVHRGRDIRVLQDLLGLRLVKFKGIF